MTLFLIANYGNIILDNFGCAAGFTIKNFLDYDVSNLQVVVSVKGALACCRWYDLLLHGSRTVPVRA